MIINISNDGKLYIPYNYYKLVFYYINIYKLFKGFKSSHEYKGLKEMSINSKELFSAELFNSLIQLWLKFNFFKNLNLFNFGKDSNLLWLKSKSIKFIFVSSLGNSIIQLLLRLRWVRFLRKHKGFNSLIIF